MGCTSSRPRTLGTLKKVESTSTDDMEPPRHTESDVMLKPSMYIGDNKNDFNSLYSPSRKLGSGAYGNVYLCTRKETSKQYAVKVIKKENLSEQKLSNDLLKEVNYLKELDHPNIAKLHDVYEDETAYYIVMDACYGGELFEQIIKRKKLTENCSALIIKQILSGVCYLHKNRIVHRDLKPENLLLETEEPNSRIKIVDFGLSARLLGQSLRERLGTVYYIAPEVIKKNYDEKCDVWSCGVILYILLCGYPPFSAGQDNEIIQKIVEGSYTFPSKEWSKVSSDAKDLINRMLTYDSKKRISAAQALRHQWIARKTKDFSNVMESDTMSLALSNLRSFTKTQKLGQAAMLLMANKFTTNEEVNELTKLFSELDTNGDGSLDRTELLQGYRKVKQHMSDSCSKMTDEEIKKEVNDIIKACDLDHSGTINYSEFITGCIDKSTLLSKERLKLAFSTFDADGSGKISKKEITEIFGLCKLPDSWSTLLEDIDINHDGEIDFDEFVSMLNQVSAF
ncbi:calmodulin-domain protein kinase [Theileria orientalis]|uniref:Calcium-dependent protein kinase 1 n=1 Tax=Theileria orientalis TaxID=68886 RepID=A0A976MA75_THEOR|nr:calmodulin-domain protein kinase [Theileria orientalis]